MTTATKTAAPRPAANPQQSRLIIGGIIGVAIIAAVAFIIISLMPRSSGIDYSSIPQSRLADGGFVLGNPEARVTIVEFADYICPHCQDYKPTAERFIRDFVVTGQAKFEFRVLPTAGGETTAQLGRLAVCFEAQKPGAYWNATEEFFSMYSRGDSRDVERKVANNLGVDYAAALNCTRDDTQMQTDLALAQRAQVQSTPSIRMRLDSGDLIPITFGGTTYDRGPAPYEALAGVVAQYSS
jgi:predicted DsbA family dithiol-disulfide isomerase